MAIWIPKQISSQGPRYEALVSALERDIQTGRAEPGMRLLPMRELAYQLGISVGTVTRAYQTAQKRGLISGEVGRGSFVRTPDKSDARFFGDGRGDLGSIDLSLNLPPTGRSEAALQKALSDLSKTDDLSQLMQYLPHSGLARHRQAIAKWWKGNHVDPDCLVLTQGAQHAMALAVAALTKPGDTVICESMSYAGIKALANFSQLRLVGAPLDRDGVIPEKLEELVQKTRARVLYLIPNLQNPSATVLPESRRRAIADIMERHALHLIEGDVYDFLLNKRLDPIAEYARERTFYVGSFSKSLAPGLRIGFVSPPPQYIDRMVSGVRATAWMATPMMAEIISRWIEDGTADSLIEAKRQEAIARVALVRKLFGKSIFALPKATYHVWLDLPERWQASEFVAAAKRHGITITPTEAVIVGHHPINGVRICLGAAESITRLDQALNTLKSIVDAGAHQALSVV